MSFEWLTKYEERLGRCYIVRQAVSLVILCIIFTKPISSPSLSLVGSSYPPSHGRNLRITDHAARVLEVCVAIVNFNGTTD